MSAPASRSVALVVNTVLVAAIIIDVVLPLLAVFRPDLWFEVLHRGLSPDALALAFLRRAAAHWAAFTDITYFAVAPALSGARWVLLVPLLLNVGMALILVGAYRKIVGAGKVVETAA